MDRSASEPPPPDPEPTPDPDTPRPQRPALAPPVAAALALASGVVLDLAFPGTGWWPLAPIALAVLALALHGRSVRGGAGLGLLHGLGFFVAHLTWSGTYVGALPWLALSTLQALYLAAFGAGAVLALRAPGGPLLRAVAFAALWVAQEALRSRTPFGGFPWGRVGFSQSEAPAAGLAALGGVPLVSFAVVLTGALTAQAVLVLLGARQRRPRHRTRQHHQRLAALAVVGALVVFLGGGLVPRPSTGEREAQVSAVQGNVATPGLEFNSVRRAVLDNHAGTTGRLADAVAAGDVPQPDLVLWPENASDIDPLRNEDAAAVISAATDAIQAPVLVGAVLREPEDHLSNVGIVWNPGTGAGERYVKRRPAPFGEYIPYRSFFRTISEQVDLVPTDFVAGDEVGVLAMGPALVGDVICFEVAFDDLVRDTVVAGADLIVVQTNNATFGRTDESVQQLAMSQLRAVEHGRSVAHISTVGVSALIAPDGTMLETSGHFTQEVLSASLPLRDSLTLATRLGSWPELALSVGGLLAVVLGGIARRRAAGGTT